MTKYRKTDNPLSVLFFKRLIRFSKINHTRLEKIEKQTKMANNRKTDKNDKISKNRQPIECTVF